MTTLLCLLLTTTTVFPIAENGQPKATIVTADDATPAETTAAKELADYLGQITGATFEPVAESTNPTGAAILVGWTNAAEQAKLIPSGGEAWRIKTDGNRLYLVGGRPRGTLYAVYHLLEDQLGVRWWSPWEETVRQQQTVTLADLDRQGEPAFRYRDIYDQVSPPKHYCARNRLNGHFSSLPAEYGGTMAYGPPYHVHTFDKYIPPEKYFDQHPEYFSEINGQRLRDRSQLCLTNPEVVELVKKRLREYLATAHENAAAQGLPDPVVFDISQNDWNNQCQCANCQAAADREGSFAGPLLEFINQIADSIKDDYPDIFIDTLAYHWTLDPPKTVEPRDNVIIRLCDLSGSDFGKPLTHPDNQSFHDSVVAWSKITRNLRIWDYAVTYGDNHGMPFPSLSTMPLDYRFFKEHNVEGLFIEHEYPVEADLRDLKMWVQAKLLEDPYQNYDALVKGFTEGYYGAAGEGVREYLAALEQSARAKPSYVTGWTAPQGYRYLDLDFLVEANQILDRAAATVADDPILSRRVRHARLSLDRATVFLWPTLCREHASRGGNAQNLPLDLQHVIAPRLTRTVNEQIELRIPTSQQQKERQALLGSLPGVLAMPTFAELPKRFRDLPPGTAVDFTPDTFRRWKSIAKIIPDPDSELGVAARVLLSETDEKRREEYALNDAQPMPWGVYDNRLHHGVLSTKLEAKDVPGPGYHWYELPATKLGPAYYVYFFWSWIIQIDVDNAVPNDLDQPVTIWASLKYDGPSFPHGDPTHPDSISVERIVVVRGE